MRFFGFEISRIRNQALSPPDGRWTPIYDWMPGAWQTHNPNPDNPEHITAYWAVFSCITFIASDFAKCAPSVYQYDQSDGIWRRSLFRRPLLKRPNHYQTGQEFFFSWAVSKLLRGNMYALKVRNTRGFTDALHILSPDKCRPMVSESGDVFYELSDDNLAGVDRETVMVPASEIIHDRMYPLYHPLVGVSPLYACGPAAAQGLAIQNSSKHFFANNAIPGGILTAPGKITDETAKRLKDKWRENYSGKNTGNVAVLGDDLKFQQMTVPAEDSQLIQQLKMTAEMVCACFHFPGYKIGVGQIPTAANAGLLNQQYFDQCLHPMFELAEARLDHGLELPDSMETWFDIDNLLRMDRETRYKSHTDAIGGGWMAPNEARRKEDMAPVDGGDSPMIQQQNYSLAALAKRDARDDPFSEQTGTGNGERRDDDGLEEFSDFLSDVLIKDQIEARSRYLP